MLYTMDIPVTFVFFQYTEGIGLVKGSIVIERDRELHKLRRLFLILES